MPGPRYKGRPPRARGKRTRTYKPRNQGSPSVPAARPRTYNPAPRGAKPVSAPKRTTPAQGRKIERKLKHKVRKEHRVKERREAKQQARAKRINDAELRRAVGRYGPEYRVAGTAYSESRRAKDRYGPKVERERIAASEKARADDRSRSNPLNINPSGPNTVKKPPTEIHRQGVAGTDDITRPASKILNELTRASEVMTGVQKSLIKDFKKGGSPTDPRVLFRAGKAGVESGVTRKKVVRGKDVMKELGIGGTLGRVLGTADEFVTDPLIAVPGGVIAKPVTALSRASRGARAARRATKKTPRLQGGTPTERAAARRARASAARAAYSRKHSPKAQAKKRERQQRLAPDPIRDSTSKVFPIRQAKSTPAEHKAVTEAGRTARGIEMSEAKTSAKASRGMRRAAKGQRTRLGKRKMKAEQSDRIWDAIEDGTVSKLSAGEQSAARQFRRETERQYHNKRREAMRAGEKPPARYQRSQVDVEEAVPAKQLEAQRSHADDVAGERGQLFAPDDVPTTRQVVRPTPDEPAPYVPRIPTDRVSDPALRRRLKRTGQRRLREAKKGAPSGSRVRTTTLKDRMRTRRGPMSQVREDDPAGIVRDLETTLQVSGQKAAAIQATTYFRGEIKKLGRKPPKDAGSTPMRPDEGVFEIHTTGTKIEVREVTKPDHLAALDPEHAVILRRDLADTATKAIESAGHKPWIDIPTHTTKFALTVPNPQYWLRNAYGGIHNMYQEGMPARAVPLRVARAIRINRAVAKRSRNLELGRPTAAIKRGKRAARNLEKRRGRRIAGERAPTAHEGRKTIDLGKSGETTLDDFLNELERFNVSGQGQTVELMGARSAPRHIAQGFEDMPRVASYYHYRRKGLSETDASQHVQNSQFDYGQLTGFEKAVMRRIFPFYTWRSRNIAFQAKTLVQRPIKMANIEKSRDFAAEEAGMPKGWEDKLSKSEALQLPIPIGGKNLAYPALPTTDLNMLNASPKFWLEQAAGMGNPVIKNPIEQLTNYSFYFKGPLQEDYNMWSPAPKGIAGDALSKVFGSWMRKNGKGEWEWTGRARHLANMIPASSVGSMGASGDPNFEGRAFGWATGVRVKKYAPLLNEYTKRWDLNEELEEKIATVEELATGRTKSGLYKKQLTDLKNRQSKNRWAIQGLAKRLDKKISEPQTKKGKVYKPGYDPEKGRNPGETGKGGPQLGDYGPGAAAPYKPKGSQQQKQILGEY